MRLRPVGQFNDHIAGRRNKRKQSLELARPGRAESQHRQDHDGMRPRKLCRVARVDEAHGIAALLREVMNGGRSKSHCNADASAFVARDACNCSWRSWCSLNTKATDRLRYDRCTGPLAQGPRKLTSGTQADTDAIASSYFSGSACRQTRSAAKAAPAWPEPSAFDQK